MYGSTVPGFLSPLFLSRNLPPMMPLFLAGGSKIAMASSERKYDRMKILSMSL